MRIPAFSATPNARAFVIAAVAAALIASVVLTLGPLLACELLNWDDPAYVLDEHVVPGLSWSTIRWAFTTRGVGGVWMPLTYLSHQFVATFAGVHPYGHHLANLILHGLCALAVLALLLRATGRLVPSAFVAFAFALHPMAVEPVAWVAERKGLLAGLLWLVVANAYVSYTRRRSLARYALLVIPFVLALLCKPTAVVAPLTLLALDVWPLASPGVRPGRLLAEKLPLLALGAVLVGWLLRTTTEAGATALLDALPLGARSLNALVGYGRYLAKLVAPLPTAIAYPLAPRWPTWWILGAGASVALALLLAVVCRKRHAHVTAGLAWFFVAMLPTCGLVQHGMQAIADRHTYIPYVGLFWAIAFTLDDLARARRSGRGPVIALAGAALVAWAATARAETRHWHDSVAVFSHAVANTSANYTGEVQLGRAYLGKNRFAEAIAHLRIALGLVPGDARARTSLGNALVGAGRSNEAEREYRMAIERDPRATEPRRNLAGLLLGRGDAAQALEQYEAAAAVAPADARLWLAAGSVALVMGDTGRATSALARAVLLDSGDAEAWNQYGVALALAGDATAARAAFLRVLARRPGDQRARHNLELVGSPRP